jgi:asparagine synthase (glutamine-hydrolysing)
LPHCTKESTTVGALFGFTGATDMTLFQRMADVLNHRGSYAWVYDTSPYGSIGYRPQFAEVVRDQHGAGIYSDGACTLALAGYLTNDDLPRPVLPALLAVYRQQGPMFVAHLRGAFVLIVRDGARLHLARDGAGMRTVYYGRHAGRLLFAIEPKGILAAPGFPRRIRPAAVAQYLTFSFIPGSGTMLEDVHEIPAGHLLSYDGSAECLLQRYFHFERCDRPIEQPDDVWIQNFRDTHARAVAERLPSGEPVGVFLSGGIDSSVVTAEVARQHTQRVKTYAIHFGAHYPHELEFAHAVAQRCHTEHSDVLIRPRDFLPRLRKIIWHLDEPIGDPITVPNFELSAHVAQEVRWVFNGEGGDPCFGGPKNLPMLLHHWYGGLERAENFRERLYLASYRRAYDALWSLLSPEWQRLIDPKTDLEAILTPFFRPNHPMPFLNKLMAMNIRLKGAHLILPKVERMTSAWGLTALAPLFDERLICLSFAMPPRLKVAGGVEKRILKLAYADALPTSVLTRPKSGMRVPVHYWLQGEMRRYARHILQPQQIRRAGLFHPERVRQLLRYDGEGGSGRYGLRLWMLMTLEIWRRLVVEREPL